jgi:hypothetical protein
VALLAVGPIAADFIAGLPQTAAGDSGGLLRQGEGHHSDPWSLAARSPAAVMLLDTLPSRQEFPQPTISPASQDQQNVSRET